MEARSQKILRLSSTSVIVLFSSMLFIAALISEFFQAPKIGVNVQKLYSNPLQAEFLDNLDSFKLENNLGSYTLSNTEHGWDLVEPRSLKANEQLITVITKALKELKVKRLYQLDPINAVNFGINNPSIKMSLGSGEKKQNLTFGLINSIDDSTYISLEGKKFIYQVNAPKLSLEALILVDFIDGRTFPFDFNNLNKIALYQNKSKRPYFKIQKKNNDWVDSRNRKLDKVKIERDFKPFFEQKSKIILDKRDDKLNEQITKLTSRPVYRIEFTIGDKTHEYLVSPLVRSLSNVTIESRQNVLLNSKALKHPVLLPKKFLSSLLKRESRYKLSKIQKLLY